MTEKNGLLSAKRRKGVVLSPVAHVRSAIAGLTRPLQLLCQPLRCLNHMSRGQAVEKGSASPVADRQHPVKKKVMDKVCFLHR